MHSALYSLGQSTQLSRSCSNITLLLAVQSPGNSMALEYKHTLVSATLVRYELTNGQRGFSCWCNNAVVYGKKYF
jgi:hypothetical protein